MAEKTVLITGCSSGIGKLTAMTFHEKGWNVVATMRSPERETELTNLDRVVVDRLDVVDEASVRQAVENAIERFGAIDVLVNNAGRGGHALLEQMSDEKVRDLYEINVFGVMNVTRAVLPHMRRRKSGCIINVTSVAGMIGLPCETGYCSAKFAVEGFTEALAWECKPLNVDVKSVAPGVYMKTSFGSNADNDDLLAGDEELVTHAKRLREHFLEAVRSEGGETADPQEVADKIFECATTATPVHNPVGNDAQRIVSWMGGPPRQDFLDKVEPLLVPPQGEITSSEPGLEGPSRSAFPSEHEVLRSRLLASVKTIADRIAGSAPESEISRALAPEAVTALRSSGLIAMKSPRSVGGAEAHPLIQMDVIEALTRIDPAAGWSLLITSGIAARVFSSMSEDTVRKLRGEGSFPFFAGSLRPAGIARAVKDGFEVSGRWSWASGVSHADYVVAPIFLEDRSGMIWAVVPVDQVGKHDNWFPLGLKGTGSSDFSLEQVFVPSGFASLGGRAVRGGPLYRLGYGSAAHEHGVFACALARAALDSALASAIDKKRGYGAQKSIADREAFQSAVAEGEIRINASRLLMADAAERLFDAAADDEAPVALQAEARAVAVFCTSEAIEVTTKLFRFAGGSAVMQGAPMERTLRDLFTAQSHLFVSDSAYENLGRLRLGLTEQAPLG
jgi:NAD(P)-dependent dehydrogenase (short-subunit alcohol dehydrogenase family)/alkylation response protein AidB-like acyl-CoA dehydrogenase